MQCPVCHNEVTPQNAFCNHCGAPMAGAATQAVPMGAGDPIPPAYAAQPVAAESGLSDNAAGAIAYITIVPAIIFLVLAPYNRIPFVKFHSWQSIGLCLVAVIVQTLVTVVEVVMHFIPGIILLFTLLHLAIWLGFFFVWLYVVLRASKGDWYKLPVIGDFAEKQARS